MKQICALSHRPAWLMLPCVFALLLLPVTGCEDDTGLKTDTGAQKDGPVAGKDTRPDVKADTKTIDVGKKEMASTDLPSPDGPPVDAKPEADQGACKQNGESCGGAKGTCCAKLKCCTGTPVPPGKEYCAATCPKSDRNVKYGFKSASSKKILEQLSRLPISTWTYKDEPRSVRHIGPMAQDFKAVFGVGATERFISPLDAAGVALISIQALNGQIKMLGQDVKALRQENRSLRRLLRKKTCR